MISDLPRRLPTGCASLRWAGAKAACRGALRPAAVSGDALRRPTMGRDKSHLPGWASCLRQRLPTGCAALRRAGVKAACRGVLPACGIWRRAAPPYNGQEQKRPAGGDLLPAAASTDKLRRSAMGRGKSHLPGCAPACCGIWRRAAAAYDGQEQKPPAGVIFGHRQRLPTGCAALRWAGVKATRRGVLRPAAPSTDRLRLSAMGRSKSHLPG